jgi:hypothetical protein
MTESNTGHDKNWRSWLGHLADKPNVNGLEIGSFEGGSAVFWLNNILTHPTSSITCVDTWHGGIDLPVFPKDELFDKFLANIGPWRNRVIIRRGMSDFALRKLPVGYYDFCYVDACHTAAATLSDSVQAWHTLKSGGIMIWDDYTWEVDPRPVMRPKIAIDAFLECFSPVLELISKQYQVAVKKI